MMIWKGLIDRAYILVLFFYFYGLYRGVDFNIIAENQFNIMTMNTVFVGFLFISLGIIAGFSDNASIRKFERIKAMDNI